MIRLVEFAASTDVIRGVKRFTYLFIMTHLFKKSITCY